MQLTTPIIAGIASVFVLLLSAVIVLSLKVAGVFSDAVRTEEVIKTELDAAVDACKADFDNNETVIKVFKSFTCKEADEQNALNTWASPSNIEPKLADNAVAIRLFKVALLLEELIEMKKTKCLTDSDDKCQTKLDEELGEIPQFSTTLKDNVLTKFDLAKFHDNPIKLFQKLKPEDFVKDLSDKDKKEAAKIYISTNNHIVRAYLYSFQELHKMCDEKTNQVLKAL